MVKSLKSPYCNSHLLIREKLQAPKLRLQHMIKKYVSLHVRLSHYKLSPACLFKYLGSFSAQQTLKG